MRILTKVLIVAYFIVGLFFIPLYAQKEAKLDSLINAVNSKNIDDTLAYHLCIRISIRQGANSDTIVKYAKKALAYSRKLKKPQWESAPFVALGDAYRVKGEHESSISYYLRAANSYGNFGNEIGLGTAFNGVGSVYSSQKNFSNALNYYNKAVLIFTNSKDSIRLASTLLNTGEVYREYRYPDSALIYFQRSKVIFNRLNYPIGAAYNLGNIGLVLAEKGRHQLAEENMNQAIKILEELGDKYPIAVYQTSLADIYAQRGEYKRAVMYAKSALNIGMDEGLKEQIRDANLKLSELYKSAGNLNLAYTYLEQYNTYRDSINNDETTRKMADLRTEYEVAKKQTEVDLLNEQATLNRVITWSAIFIIGLLLILTIALLKIYRIKDRAVRIVRQRRRVIADQRNQLDEVNKTKDRFFSIISHDIRGPISNFQGISVLIDMLADSKDADGLKKLGNMMESSAKEVSSLLDNLLEWALTQEGKMPYYPEPIDLQEICYSNLNIMMNLATAKQINLVKIIDEKLMVTADKNSVSTIIRNLLSNAIKFTPEGGEVQIELQVQEDQGVIIVKDTGIGIPKDKIDDIFSFKGRRSRWGTKGEKGIGLGLTLVNEFVELNNGRIEVESEEGKGTTFKVYLPTNSPK